MSKFGELKNKLLVKLAESYENNDKKSIKEILKVVKKDKGFKEMYLFYEAIENKYFEDKEIAKLYVEEVASLLKSKLEETTNFSKKYNILVEDVCGVATNPLYENLDLLTEQQNLTNLDAILMAKKELVNYLTTKREVVKEEVSSIIVPNENLLYAVLTSNFNALYGNTLSEEEQVELKSILEIPAEEVVEKVKILKEEILLKVYGFLTECKNVDEAKKFEEVKNEILTMSGNKLNLYKLKQLKKDLN
jgi:hypothetical protein